MRNLMLLGLVILLAGCGTLNFPTINAPKPPEQVYKYHQTINTEPRVVQTNAKGESVVFTAQQQVVDVNYDNKEKPLSFWQKLCNWLANLSILGIIGLVVFFFVAPASFLAFIVNEKNKIETAFKQTVQGIDKSGVIATTPALAQALSSTQDAATKAMVDDIQQPGK